MALSPTIPTSFVPKQPVTTGKRKYSGGNNILLVVGIFIVLVAIFACVGTFLYAQYLTSVENAKAAELVSAQANANPATVQQFLRLSNRLAAAKSIMSQHVELSQFFTLLGTLTVQNVEFNSLAITVADDRSAQLSLVGEATDFNSLAVESNEFASNKDIKSAIFSGIGLNGKNNSVTFSISAQLDPSLVVEAAPPTTPALIAATSTVPVTPTSVVSSTTTPQTPTVPVVPTKSAASSTTSAATTTATAASSTKP